jgi:uncharacterized phiE125 gp8 family phage protein
MIMVGSAKSKVWTVEAPAEPIIPLDAMKEHLRVTDTAEDDLITSILAAAVLAAEASTNRVIQQRSCTLRLASLPAGREPVVLPGGLVDSVSSCEVDGSAVEGWEVVGHSPALLFPYDPWPAVPAGNLPVLIEYVAGYAEPPEPIIAAVKLIATNLYENRSSVVIGTISSDLPMGAEWLLRGYRIWVA